MSTPVKLLREGSMSMSILSRSSLEESVDEEESQVNLA